MLTGDFIFVYGTLRSGERADLRKSSSQFSVSYIGQDAVNGQLYHIGSFPGLKLPPDYNGEFSPGLPIVRGEVFLVKDPSIGALLDCYEGYNADNPKLGHYDREVVETRTGRHAWVYTYNPMVVSDQLIETGDWKNPRLASSRSIPTLKQLKTGAR